MNGNLLQQRGDVLRAVVHAAEARRDGLLPTDVEGVRETFRDDLDLLGALSQRWSRHLYGRLDTELHGGSSEHVDAVVAAWNRSAEELPGTRSILDRARGQAADPRTARAMRAADDRQRAMLAQLSGRPRPARSGLPDRLRGALVA